MQQAGVPLIMGYHGEAQDQETLTKEALKIGLPVLLKASAGGGGIGMREVHHAPSPKRLNRHNAKAKTALVIAVY